MSFGWNPKAVNHLARDTEGYVNEPRTIVILLSTSVQSEWLKTCGFSKLDDVVRVFG